MNYLEGASSPQDLFIKDARKQVYIIDSSVVLKWFFTQNEQDVETAEILYAKTLDRDYYMVCAELLVYELLNIFKYKANFTEERIEEVIKEIFNIIVFDRIDYNIFLSACKISKKIGDSIYDSIYIAMSEKYLAPFITADKKLYGKAKKYGYNVTFLPDFAKQF
ncbi:MAG: type II toxin-antitoxin system VapC family toxin [Actinomycetota bacterium]